MSYFIYAAILIFIAALTLLFWYRLKVQITREMIHSAERHARQLTEDSARYAETIKREANLEAKEKFYALQTDLEKQMREKRQDLASQEKRLHQREENLDRKVLFLDSKERDLQARELELNTKDRELNEAQKRVDALIVEQKRVLEKNAGLMMEDARRQIFHTLETQVKEDSASLLIKTETDAKQRADELARKILLEALERTSVENVIETCVTAVPLPSADLKGRIIGREGRNIRALEMATACDLIVDDAPEAILVSAFDPFRREVAKIAIQRLIADGRIHPARIEEVVEQTRQELTDQILRDGESTALELGISGVHPELLRLLGQLRYHSDCGQNLLIHSREVAVLAAHMAAEIGLDGETAKRAGLLHDIGRAVREQQGGTHVDWGVEYARKYGEREEVVHAIAAHHRDIPCDTAEAFLVQTANSISSLRPGARREVLETYVQRLEKLEKLAQTFPGVLKAYAVQAGREIRVLVDAHSIDDRESVWLSKDIARKLEAEIHYPGQIKVTVIRETRAVDYARKEAGNSQRREVP